MRLRQRLCELERRVACLEHSESISQEIRSPPSPTDVIDSSPKACELDIFSAKVSLASYELRDIIEAVSVAGASYSKDGIISKLQHAFDAVKRHTLEHGLSPTSEPDIDGAIDRVVALRQRAGWSRKEESMG